MRYPLIRHPSEACEAVDRIEVECNRDGGLLHLRYIVTGRTNDIALPPAGEPQRRAGLWEHTCFEAFIGKPDDYLELNLSPSRAWEALRFHGYRQGGWRAGIEPPAIVLSRGKDGFTMTVAAQIGRWDGPLALAAVIEEENGNISHWALCHAGDVADFHRPDCFVLELPPAERA